MTDTTTDYFGDRWLSGSPTYLTDLDRCQPASALYPGAKARHWRMHTYETDTLSGIMLRADTETDAPEVTYPLDVSGWHAVSIGMKGDSAFQVGNRVEGLARLSGDNTFSLLSVPLGARPERQQIRELFWKIADLTGQDIVFAQLKARIGSGEGPGSVFGSHARIAYIKLIPLTDAEVAALQADGQRAGTRRLFGHNDAHGHHYDYRPTTEEEIRRHLEMFRDTDFSRLYYECGMGDLLFYLGKAGRIPTFDGLDDFLDLGDRLHRESWQVLRDKGIDPFQVALDHAHDMGLEFHASYRVAGFRFPPDHDHFDHGDSFYARHPELRGMDKNGNRIPRLSYAYPEVRRFVVNLLREVAGYDVDGICLLYNRRPPLVEYEPPLVEGFQAEYGKDPRKLDDADPRWLAYRARTLTQFHREVRQALDDEAERQGRRRFELSAVVLRNHEENMLYAMDLKAWIDEGLVDTIIPYTSAVFLDSTADSWDDPRDADYFLELTRGTPSNAAFGMLPHQLPAETYRRRAAGLYGAGAEHLFFWDCQPGRGDYTESWSALRRLGHRDELDGWVAAGEPGLDTPRMALRKVDDYALSYGTPG